MHYRSEIDGLRALAVLAILAFHAGLPLPGGFLGVDVFFVISGYLITSIIDREAEQRAFSLLGFYRRRVARILPALLLMLIVTCLVGGLVLLPGELRALCASAAAAAGFASNIHFWREAAYFGGMAEARPLLHTWSLGVEEQFYLFYPLALPLALRRWGRDGARLALLVGAAASLTLCLLYARSNPTPIFYLLPGRVWEIGLGALAALGAPAPSIRRPGGKGRAPSGIGREAGSGIGLVLVIAALVRARPDTIAQHLWAVAACTGTVLLLVDGGRSRAGAVLSIAPLRVIGLASYSIYLWHWPVLSLYRIVHGRDLDAVETGGLVLASLVLAALSYLLVERPMRRRLADGPGSGTRVVGAGIVASAALAGAVLLIGANADTVRDLPPDVRRVAAFSDYWRTRPAATALERRCAADAGADAGAGIEPRPPACPAGASDAGILLAGDSHANHIRHALRFRFPADHVVAAIAMGCRPLVDAPPSRCTEPFRRALRTGVATGRVRAVVLAAQWREDEVGSLVDTIRVLRSHGARVTVVGPVVEYDGDFPRILARAMLLHDLRSVDTLRRRARQRLDRRMAIAVRATGARYFSAYDRECPNDRCRLFSSRGEPMHFDYGHYTRSASVDILAGMSPP